MKDLGKRGFWRSFYFGRGLIHQYFLEKGLRIGEQEIPYDLKRLAEMGLVQVNKGRRGTVITDKGKGFVRKKLPTEEGFLNLFEKKPAIYGIL